MANLSLIFILIPAIIAVVLVLAMCVVVARTPSRSFHGKKIKSEDVQKIIVSQDM